MNYIEVFKPSPQTTNDPGRLFYTITPEDVGHRFIKTTAGVIALESVLGYVQSIDVGKRIYRVPCEDPTAPWIWQAESQDQFLDRKRRSA